jgi:hypothetical protein
MGLESTSRAPAVSFGPSQPLRWPSLAFVCLCWPCIGLCGPTLGLVGFRVLSWAFGHFVVLLQITKYVVLVIYNK